jgi:alpha-1,6-mannosyltransferase
MKLATLAFAFLVPHADQKLVNPRQRLAIALLVFAAVIFRSEIALLLGTSALYLLIIPETSLGRLIIPFIISFVAALGISVPVDSYFWQKPLWPELWGFYYNAVLGSSSNWGVSPWHFYFTSALPRLLLNPLVPVLLIPLALRHPSTTSAARRFVVPSLLFVAIYSLQPHKEARFIFYVVPPITAAGALGANVIFNRRSKSAGSTALALVVAVSVLATLAISTAILLVSSLNYPGGEALSYLRDLIRSQAGSGNLSTVVPVHADVLACMTGVTLFGTAAGKGIPSMRGKAHVVPGTTVGSGSSDSIMIALDKTEDDPVLLTETFWTRFDYVMAEDIGKLKGGEWDEIAVVYGFAGVEILKPAMMSASSEPSSRVVGKGATVLSVRDSLRKWTGGWWVGPKLAPKIHILQRRKDIERSSRAMNS